jgi:ribonucleoside-diphosphate reductase alpha chain
MEILKRDGSIETLDISKIQKCCEWATEGLDNVSQSELETDSHLILTPGISTSDIQRSLIITAARKISLQQPNWTFVAARLLMQSLYKQANEGSINYKPMSAYLKIAAEESKIDTVLLELFDLTKIDDSIVPDRDLQLDYLGLSSLANRYLVRVDETVIEMPQHFFMRVAMGIAKIENSQEKRTAKAIEYYNMYSSFSAMPSTPTLFNSGTPYPQLSSCFISKCGDDIDAIMECMKENANYSKFAGGTAVSFSSVRAQGSKIKSTGGKAGGPVPYIKILNDVLNGFDQSGKRKGSGAVYIEPWHSDIEAFLDLRQPGDDRLRAHDVFPALWVPDLFMLRVEQKETWSLFDPAKVPHLANLYGKEFEDAYDQAEQSKLYERQIDAFDLWKKILQRLSEEGVNWVCFKDPSNARYALNEIGFVASSNLCTEILLRTSEDTSSVCNLHSVNVGKDSHLLDLDSLEKSGFKWNYNLEKTVRTAIRALDSVISVGIVPHAKGKKTNDLDRPVGLGVMGYAVALQKQEIDWASQKHFEYANELMRQITITAIDESANLGQELGSFPTFSNSTWSKGILPLDTFDKNHLENLKHDIGFNLYSSYDSPFCTEQGLREKVKVAFRNATLTAIAPTASISNIVGTTPCIELPYKLCFEKENLNGQFLSVSPTALIKNSVEPKTARQVDQNISILANSIRQRWICQSQSLNLFLNEDTDGDGKAISDFYFKAWKTGTKTTYYLRGLAVDSNEKVEPEIEEGAACYFRPGDAGFEECEVCQ